MRDRGEPRAPRGALVRPRRGLWRLARNLFAPWAGRPICLLLDETPKANDLRALGLRLAHAHRALPLATVCYRFGASPRPLPELVRELLQQVLACLPANTTVVLLADRGLAWPTLVDWCQEHGWHYVLRLQGATHVRFPDGSEQAVRDLAPEVGRRWLGEAAGAFRARKHIPHSSARCRVRTRRQDQAGARSLPECVNS